MELEQKFQRGGDHGPLRSMTRDDDAKKVEQLLEVPKLAEALESDRFKQFLDHVPFAVAVSELHPSERIVYVNLEFERLTGCVAGEIYARQWSSLLRNVTDQSGERTLSKAIREDDEYIGEFEIQRGDAIITVDAWANTIQDDNGVERFRLLALADISRRGRHDREIFEQTIREKDTLLRELQHRVKNNLQMVTALIRLEARNLPEEASGERFDRLAGRVEALALLYSLLSGESGENTIDLGVYLSQVAAAVMKAHASEGVRLDLKVDTWPVSINVAMPTGLVINELLTNALKHAFADRGGGTIKLHSLVDDTGCRVVVADDGVGLKDGSSWPQPGKLAALIVESLRQNANARVEVESVKDRGVRVSIFFAKTNAAVPN
jgi:PAS domain S-box-containing protein